MAIPLLRTPPSELRVETTVVAAWKGRIISFQIKLDAATSFISNLIEVIDIYK